ncbi:hypothetical protein Taro_050610 [Colocasia esculenta]|uniref:Homeobox domain-containing protein n=1 Tax=Colocasia esculenta TaxID=4460 RepID=A0A843XE90_COLES|nr:hypothetical protein [Colocasia esculenta]
METSESLRKEGEEGRPLVPSGVWVTGSRQRPDRGSERRESSRARPEEEDSGRGRFEALPWMERSDRCFRLRLRRAAGSRVRGTDQEGKAATGRRRTRKRRAMRRKEEGSWGYPKLRLSKEQASILEDAFRQHHTLNPKLQLAKELNLRPRQVEVWFQNRRARTKVKKTEVDCELLKRCCENLTEENRRLQRELLELRALKRPPPAHVYLQAGDLAAMPPTTTILAVCPSCERAAPPRAVATESKYHRRSTSLPLQLPQILLS